MLSHLRFECSSAPSHPSAARQKGSGSTMSVSAEAPTVAASLPEALALVPARCCVCGDENADPIAVGEDFEYRTSADSFLAVHCRGCGLVYLNPRPAPRRAGADLPSHVQRVRVLRGALRPRLPGAPAAGGDDASSPGAAICPRTPVSSTSGAETASTSRCSAISARRAGGSKASIRASTRRRPPRARVSPCTRGRCRTSTCPPRATTSRS
jgi:hypothetical protein